MNYSFVYYRIDILSYYIYVKYLRVKTNEVGYKYLLTGTVCSLLNDWMIWWSDSRILCRWSICVCVVVCVQI